MADLQSKHKVAVAGASGRMGHILIEEIRASADCQLAGALDIAASPAIGNDAAAFLGHAGTNQGVSNDSRENRAQGASRRRSRDAHGHPLAHPKETGPDLIAGGTAHMPVPNGKAGRSGRPAKDFFGGLDRDFISGPR